MLRMPLTDSYQVWVLQQLPNTLAAACRRRYQVVAVRAILDGTGRVFRETDNHFLTVARFLGRPIHWQPFAFVQTEFDKIWELAGPGEMVSEVRPPALTLRPVRERFRRSIIMEVRRLRIDFSPAEVDKLADRMTEILDQVLAGAVSIDDITALRAADRVVAAASRSFADFLVRKPSVDRKKDRKAMLQKIFEENVMLQNPED